MEVEIPNSVTFISDRAFENCDNVVIYGYAGSYAQTYAQENTIPFVELEKEVKDRIISLYFDGDDLIATLKFGNVTLRPDALAKKLKTLYGGEKINIIKQDVKFLNDLTCDEYVKGKNNV